MSGLRSKLPIAAADSLSLTKNEAFHISRVDRCIPYMNHCTAFDFTAFPVSMIAMHRLNMFRTLRI